MTDNGQIKVASSKSKVSDNGQISSQKSEMTDNERNAPRHRRELVQPVKAVL